MPLDSLGYTAPVGYVETKIVDADGEVLRRAADIIEQYGWWQAPPGHVEGTPAFGSKACIINAVCFAGGEGNRLLLSRMGFPTIESAWAWNDTPGRTKAEVIARLRSAAEQGAS